MRFSILVPVYNVFALLPQCIESIRAQDCQDYEVVLVDDGSTDGSGVLCDAYAREDSRVRVVHQNNRGLLMARRAAVQKARGEYLVSLDSDDRLHPDLLGLVSREIERCSPDIVAFAYSRSETFEVFGASRLSISTRKEAGQGSGEEFRRIVCEGLHNSLWSKVVRRSVVDVSQDYSEYCGLTYGEDLLQLCAIADKAGTFSYIDSPLYYYRPNPKSSTGSYSEKQLDDLDRVLRTLFAYADLWGGDCPRLARVAALRQYEYLLRILMASRIPKTKRRGEFIRLGENALRLGAFGEWASCLPFYKRAEIEALRRCWYGPAHAIASVLELAARLANRKTLRLPSVDAHV